MATLYIREAVWGWARCSKCHANKTLTGASWCANLLFFCISSDSLSSDNIKMHGKKLEKDFQMIDNGLTDHASDHLLYLHLIWLLTWLLARYQVTQSIFWLCNQPVNKESSNSMLLLTRGQLLHSPQGAVTQSLGQARKQTWALGGISSWSHKLASTVLTSPSVPFLTHLGGATHEIE